MASFTFFDKLSAKARDNNSSSELFLTSRRTKFLHAAHLQVSPMPADWEPPGLKGHLRKIIAATVDCSTHKVLTCDKCHCTDMWHH